MAAHREKKRFEGLLLTELMIAKVERGMQFCCVEIVVKWKRRNHRDVENYRHPIVKPLADALVAGGFLPDDTEEWFGVRDVRFEYPQEWPFSSQLTGYMDIGLEASYQ